MRGERRRKDNEAQPRGGHLVAPSFFLQMFRNPALFIRLDGSEMLYNSTECSGLRLLAMLNVRGIEQHAHVYSTAGGLGRAQPDGSLTDPGFIPCRA